MDQKTGILFMQSQAYFGADSMIHSLIMRSLDRDRFEVHVACGTDRSQTPPPIDVVRAIPDVRVRPTYFGPMLDSGGVKQALRGLPLAPQTVLGLGRLALYARRNRIQIVHGTEKPRDALYGLLVSRLAGAKSVVHLHIKYGDWISPLTRWAMRRADAIIGVSDFVAASVLDAGYPQEKVFGSFNAIDVGRWDCGLDGAPVRAEFGIAPHTAVLTIVARMFHWKGHLNLVRALAGVKQQHPDFRLLVVGADDPRGDPTRGPLSQELGALISELDLSDHVTFTGSRGDVDRILAASDVFVLPSFEEPFGVAFLEAMAMRRPVVGLRSGGVPEFVEHEKAGLLSEPDDIAALTANILRLVEDPQLRRDMGEYGRAQVETRFTPRRLTERIEAIYDQTLRR